MADELTCNDCAEWLHPYLDNELGAEMAARVNMHLAKCAGCKARFAEMWALQSGIRQQAPYYPAPELMQQRIMSNLNLQKTSPSPKRWLMPVASIAALAASLLLYVAVPSSEDAWVDEAVSDHVRSLMAAHLNDVASSDKHTVKPWFAGKLDFSPPVYDFSAQGFPLLGGRLDYLHQQNAAALSYGHNKHIINLFILPTAQVDSAAHTLSKRGYNIISWQQNHMRFVAVSDLNKSELEAFSQLVQKGM